MNRYAAITFTALALATAGCSSTVGGHPTAAPATAAEHMQTDAMPAPLSPAPSTSEPVKELSLEELVAAVNRDATAYWAEHGAVFPVLYVSTDFDAAPCASHDPMMAVCDGTIYYRTEALDRERHKDGSGGDVLVAENVAHEVGHGLLHYTNTDNVDKNTRETRADCGSGAFTASKFDAVTEDRAVELFDRTPMFNRDGIPTQAFRTGFEAERDGGDVVHVCTTYTMRGR